MFGLKIFVRVQTFRQGLPVPPHNFCHPASVHHTWKFESDWGLFSYLWQIWGEGAYNVKGHLLLLSLLGLLSVHPSKLLIIYTSKWFPLLISYALIMICYSSSLSLSLLPGKLPPFKIIKMIPFTWQAASSLPARSSHSPPAGQRLEPWWSWSWFYGWLDHFADDHTGNPEVGQDHAAVIPILGPWL